MKLWRSLAALVVLAGLVVGQAPAPAYCQMGAMTALAGTCQMPCCKHIPQPSCPHLRAAQPHDVIAQAPVSMAPILHLVAAGSASICKPIQSAARLAPLAEVITRFLIPRFARTRAPPAVLA